MKQTSGMLAAAIALCACSEGGKLAAERTGDLSYPIPARLPPGEAQLQECGDGAFTERGELAVTRRPYLQQVPATKATVALAAAFEEAPVLDITRPDGTAVVSQRMLVDSSARPTSGQQLVARLEQLEPSTVYCYQVRGLTELAGLYTAPSADRPNRVRFIAFGDSGDGSDAQRAVADQMYTVPFEFMIHTGDLAYADGRPSEIDRNFFDVYAPLLQGCPMYPSPGNHDYHTNNAAPFFEAFILPENGAEHLPERYYSFDVGDVHFVALDTQLTGSEQADWLDRDLSETDRPWKIVYGHKPPYSSGTHGSDHVVRRTFSPIFERHGVQLAFFGHDHDYERTYPQNGVTYVVTGGGGHGTRGVGVSSFTAFSEDVLHFVYVEVEGDRLTLHAVDGVGREFDSARVEL